MCSPDVCASIAHFLTTLCASCLPTFFASAIITASAMFTPRKSSKLRRMFSGLNRRFLMMSAVRLMMWSVRITASGMIIRSHEELVRSRSSQSVLFNKAGSTYALITLASPHTCSDFIGLRLCGMVDEPTCLVPKPSSTSAISLRWRFRISMQTLSSVVATFARNIMNSACLSRWMS